MYALFDELVLDPRICARQTFLERNLRLPAEDLAKQRVIGIAATDTLRTSTVSLDDGNTGDSRNHVRQLVDTHHAVLAQIEWFWKVRPHELVDTLHAVVNVAKRSGLFPIAPDVDLPVPSKFRDSNLSADRSGSLFP